MPAPSPISQAVARARWKATAAVTVVALVAASLAATPTPAAAACPELFPHAFRAALADRYPGQRVTASVHDTRSGCWSHLHHGMQIQTASTIKAQFLGGVLLRAQDEGRGLTPWERDRIAPMISLSHNPPASELFVSLGGVAGQERLDERFGLGATRSTSRWGATTTTAHDRTLLALQLLHGGGPLGADGRGEAWRAMTAVHPSQQWGITAGVPTGWSVALKNGFYPTSGTPRWRIGSTGFVREHATGQGYAVTVLTDQNPDHATGQRLVEEVSRHIAGTLTTGPPAARALHRATCVATVPGESWPGVAARLGTGDVTDVRSVSGNPASPLRGMRACRPDLAPAYDPDSPDAHYVDATFGTFLGREPTPEEAQQRWIPLATGRSSRLDLTRALSRSEEWLHRAIDQQYRSIFDRPVDASGAATWTRSIRSGSTMSRVTVQLLSSAEFHQRAGSTTSGFVTDLYRRVLGREPGAGEVRYWVDRLARGTSRHDVATGFHASTESRRLRVDAVYRMVLGRAADAGGSTHWAARLTREDDVVLAALLATSAEYHAAAQPN